MNERLIELAAKGEEFLGKEITPGSQYSEDYSKWRRLCRTVIETLYGKQTKEYLAFKKASSPERSIESLRALAALVVSKNSTYSSAPTTIVNVNQSQIVTVQNEISLQVLLNIEHSDLSEPEKKEAKELFEKVKEEVQKHNTNWDKVKGFLKKSIDYGLKIAPDIVKLASAYYQAKGK